MRLIVTNGDAAATRLKAAGIDTPILPWRDVLHDGPVPRMEGLAALSRVRAHFLAGEFGLPEGDVIAAFDKRDRALMDGGHDEIALVVEHDLYDQLQLVQVLATLAGRADRPRVLLGQAGFHLGEASADAVRDVADDAQPVPEAVFELAREAWAAFTAASPHALMALLKRDLTAMPYLAAAIRRLLEEYPDPLRGLGLTEHRVLMELATAPARPADLFRAVSASENARFMGDASFFHRLDRLAFCEEPLIAGLAEGYAMTGGIDATERYLGSLLTLTAAGHAVLAGRVDNTLVNDQDFWIGGVHFTPATQIRYDRRANLMIAQP